MRQILLILPLLVTSSSASCPSQCTCNLERATCSGLQLIEVPTDFERHVHHLNLSNNELTTFTLENLPQLQSLDLSHNLIQSASFIAHDNLREINLSGNKLKTVTIENLFKLEKLDFSNNEGFNPAESLYSNSLEYLDLSNNNLREIFWDMDKETEKLKTLILAHNPIQTIRFIFSETIETLDITNCNILNLQSSHLAGLPNLYHLTAKNNRQMNITLDDYELEIENANFSNSSITRFVISALNKVQELDFSSNRLKQIDTLNFRANRQLTKLNISLNLIREINGDAFLNNANIKIFDMSFNFLQSVQWTRHLVGVKHFRASSNKIISLTLLSLKNATEVDLSNNLIPELSLDLSEALPVVENLNLRKNHIEHITPLKSRSLFRLNLSYCKLRVLNNHQIFAGLSNLKYLDLEGNQLVYMNYQVVAQVKNLNLISLSHNSWACDCKSQEFKELYYYLLINNTITNPATLICATGEKWVEVCSATHQKPATTKFDENVFVWLGIFFLVALAVGMGLLYCKGRKKPDLQESPPPSSTRRSSSTRTPSMRRAHSAAEILLHRTTPESPPIQDHAPPPYEEAILLPPLTETERMTRSMDVFLNRTR